MEIGIAGRAGSVGASASCGLAWGKERLVGVNWYGVKAAGTLDASCVQLVYAVPGVFPP